VIVMLLIVENICANKEEHRTKGHKGVEMKIEKRIEKRVEKQVEKLGYKQRPYETKQNPP